MRIHFILEPDSADRFLQLGRLAESLGFEAVWTANHLSARDPFLAFSALARDSERVRMGPIAISPFELHPLKIANSLLTLNELSGGRANIVIGGGGGTLIAMHLKSGRYVMHPRMVRGVRECVEFLNGASAGKPLNYDGELFQVTGYRPAWALTEKPLIYVGATKPQMLRVAAETAHGVMFSDLTLGRLDETMGILSTALDRCGRDPGSYRINNLFAWHVKHDRNEALSEARRKLWVRGMVEQWYISPVLDDADCRLVADNMDGIVKAYVNDSPDIDGIPERIIDTLIEELTLTGDYDDIDRLVEKIRTFQAAGVNEMGLRLYDDPEASIRLIAERVGPVLAPA